MRDAREKLKEIESKREELEALNEELNCALLLRDIVPDATWPVRTCIVESKGDYRFQVKDGAGKITHIRIKKVPFFLLDRPHIKKACDSNPRLYSMVYGRR